MSECALTDLNKITQLRDAYYRRLMNLNQEIRTYRKNKINITHLNEKRKTVNKRFNLLGMLQRTPDSIETGRLYHELLKEYKNEQ